MLATVAKKNYQFFVQQPIIWKIKKPAFKYVLCPDDLTHDKKTIFLIILT